LRTDQNPKLLIKTIYVLPLYFAMIEDCEIKLLLTSH